jgi:hypothetical protein
MRYLLLVILAALAVVLVLHYEKSRKGGQAEEPAAALDKARAAALPAQFRQLASALDAYADENGEAAADLAALLPRFLPRADLLIDPWGTRLRLENNAQGDAFLVCAGPDRAFATADDTKRSL